MIPLIPRRPTGPLAACIVFLGAVSTLQAHTHLDIRPDTASSARLALVGADTETLVYVPAGEPFSNYAPAFPGGHYACELTFSHEDPDGSQPRVQLLSVDGPPGAAFAFWEAAATTSTWSRPTGWSSNDTDRPSLHTDDQGGYGHIHGRLFTVNQPGTYTVAFRAIDELGVFQPSATKTVTLTSLATPQLSLRTEAGEARLAFLSRTHLTYDLQVSTDLTTWTTVPAHAFIPGTGTIIELTDPLADRPRVFYRLVEYF